MGLPATNPAQLAIEWVGRAGHPSSFGLLGGVLASPGGFDARLEIERPYSGSLAGTADEVTWGLPADYRQALGPWTDRVRFTIAAHGMVGSSDLVFAHLAAVLTDALEMGGWSDEPATIWAAF